MQIKYKEVQKFNQWWLWLLLGGLGLFFLWGVYKQLFQGEQLGNQPMSDTGIVIFAIAIFTLIAVFFYMRLETEIDNEEIRVKLAPFDKRKILWKEVKSATLIKYGFVGGWGLRYGTKYGTVYNMRGNKGLLLELSNNKRVLIGTQKEKELEGILRKINPPHSQP